MSDNNGKVILSLLAGATAGIVTGLLLAPETGEETRSSFKKAAADLGKDLSKFFQDSFGKARGTSSESAVPNEEASVSEDRQAADTLFNSMGSSASSSMGDNATTAGQ